MKPVLFSIRCFPVKKNVTTNEATSRQKRNELSVAERTEMRPNGHHGIFIQVVWTTLINHEIAAIMDERTIVLGVLQ